MENWSNDLSKIPIDGNKYYYQLTQAEKQMMDNYMAFNENSSIILNLSDLADDFEVQKVQNGAYLISGYGLGCSGGERCIGKWYYYNKDNKFQPADETAKQLLTTITWK